MDRIRIRGGRRLEGAIPIGGAKNAALPLLAAALLTDEPLTFRNLPNLVDISTMLSLLAQHGAAVERGPDGAARLHVREVASTVAPYDIVRKMRASVLALGPLLAREGHAEVSLPGGCAIGTRPVDLHIMALEKMGAEIELEGGYIRARAPKGLSGATIRFPSVSVGATENALMAAALAKGESVLQNCAREPEIADLAQCLVAMGAKIDGVGRGTMRIEGVPRLHGADYAVMPDRIEQGTYAIAAAITGGDVELLGGRMELLAAALPALQEAGVELLQTPAGFRVRRLSGLGSVDVQTQPYPGFATDLQAQMMALMTVAEGAATLNETIFENRFMHVPELLRMGADIKIKGSVAVVRGVEKLNGAQVMATDLRASVSLVIAGLAAEGETVVNRVYHLDRGYESLEAKLKACGADVERIAA
jgi:UDP-N-acetylglucosamine 1-carboxyvinyltransferase